MQEGIQFPSDPEMETVLPETVVAYLCNTAQIANPERKIDSRVQRSPPQQDHSLAIELCSTLLH